MKKNKKEDITAKRIDELLAKYLSIEESIEHYEEQLEPYELEVISIVDQFGSMPQGSERSLYLAGEIYEALVTRAITMKVDQAKVEKLKEWVGSRAIFRELFTVETRYVVNPGAALYLAELEAKGLGPKRLRAKFMECQELKVNNPRLKVQEKKDEKGATA